MSRVPESSALLVLPRLRIQNANAISSPLTHGFPSMTAFLGFMWALERRLVAAGIELQLLSIGVICHDYQEQATQEGYVKTFCLTRNPVGKDGSTSAIVEEGRIHLELTLVFGVVGFEGEDDSQRQEAADRIASIVAGMRIAGGSVFMPGGGIRGSRPSLSSIDPEPPRALEQFRRWRRSWLPGFALVSRDDLLQENITRAAAQGGSALDAWLELSRFNWRSQRLETTNEETGETRTKIEWKHDRTHGWVVPIPVGYSALSDLREPGQVRNARDPTVRFRFVESLYSIGQWIGPHRLDHPDQLLWYADSDEDRGLYRCRNDYAESLAPSND